MQADRGTVQVLDPATGSLRIAVQTGFSAEFRPYFAGVDDDTSACGRAWPLTKDRSRPSNRSRGLPRSGVHWVEPRLVAQVAFTEWTADGQLRHPRFRSLRQGKDPADVVRELPEGTGVAAVARGTPLYGGR